MTVPEQSLNDENAVDILKTFKQLQEGEKTADKLESMLDKLEAKLDELLAHSDSDDQATSDTKVIGTDRSDNSRH